MNKVSIGLVVAIILTLAVVGVAAAQNPYYCSYGCSAGPGPNAWGGYDGGPTIGYSTPYYGSGGYPYFSAGGIGPYARFGGGYFIGSGQQGPYARFGGGYFTSSGQQGPYARFGGGYIIR